MFKGEHYFWSTEQSCFQKSSYDIYRSFSEIYAQRGGLTSDQVHTNHSLFGVNLIDVPVKSIGQLALNEVFHPFYVFQVISIILWLHDDYIVYSVVIFVMSAVSATQTIVQTRRNQKQLADVARLDLQVNVRRDGSVQRISSSSVVPGDVVQIEEMTLPCDLVIVEGSCVVNESMLTGESQPVVKTAIPKQENTRYSAADTAYTLYSGTRVVSTRGRVWAVAFGTGFSTSKGSLIKSLLYPKPTKFKFYSDSLRFIGALSLIALGGVVYSFYLFWSRGATVSDMITRSLDIITIVVPPALPVAMAMGTSFAVKRLKRSSIYCISPIRVNVGGKVNQLCFDKTGTLTEEGLDVVGAHPVYHRTFRNLRNEADTSDEMRGLMQVLAACHAVAAVNDQLVGDLLEIKMLRWSAYRFHSRAHREERDGSDSEDQGEREPQNALDLNSFDRVTRSESGSGSESEIVIAKRFEFSSSLKRMSVIALCGEAYALVKGAPEVVRNLAVQESIPDDFEQQLRHYTSMGYRVIACASKRLGVLDLHEAMSVSRSEAEIELTFEGFLLLQNKLKQETQDTMQTLNECGLHSVMITGDNALTAIHVARTCDMINSELPTYLCDFANENISTTLLSEREGDAEQIDLGELLESEKKYELAITGPAFGYLTRTTPELFERLLARTRVYSRMSPEQKAQIVELFQKYGYTNAMVGDGANDCNALKTADIGLSLSNEEASIAAPFTSTNFSIGSVIDLLRECRCALTTSVQIFKYMALYSTIQFSTVLILYHAGSALGDYAFLWIDLFVIVPLFYFMARTGSRRILTGDVPITRLVSTPVLLSVIVQTIIIFVFQVIAWQIVKHPQLNPDYMPPPPISADEEIPYQTQDTTVVFAVANFQYQWIVVAYSIGKPFRTSLIKNIPLVSCLVVGVILNALILFFQPAWLQSVLLILEIPQLVKYALAVLVVVNFAVIWVFERLVIVMLLRRLKTFKVLA